MWWKPPTRWKHGNRNQFKKRISVVQKILKLGTPQCIQICTHMQKLGCKPIQTWLFYFAVMNFNLQNIAKLLVCRVNAYAPAVDSICLYIWNRWKICRVLFCDASQTRGLNFICYVNILNLNRNCNIRFYAYEFPSLGEEVQELASVRIEHTLNHLSKEDGCKGQWTQPLFYLLHRYASF